MGKPEDFPDFEAILGGIFYSAIELIQGGATRQESVI
jgi:2-C-methyl-D-erythritol 4-phosphate cytidylyltransferase